MINKLNNVDIKNAEDSHKSNIESLNLRYRSPRFQNITSGHYYKPAVISNNNK